VIRAQSWLKGEVHLEVRGDDKVPGDELSFRMVGTEVTTIAPSMLKHPMMLVSHRGSGCGVPPQTSEHVIFDEQRFIVPYTHPVLEPGTKFNHLFSLYLPGFLPPTMRFDDGAGSSCSVKYVLTVKYGDATLDRELTLVGKPLSSKRHQVTVRPTCLPLKPLMGVIDHGFLVVAAKLNNQHVAKGRDFTLSLTCRNKSLEAIENVNVAVIERIQWKTEDGSHKEVAVELDSLADVELSTLEKGVPSGISFPSGLMEISNELNAELRSDLLKPDSEIALKIPSSALDTYNGRLLTIRHYAKVTLATASGLFHQHPAIEIPLEVYDPPIETVTPRSPSKEKITEVEVTLWPKEIVPHHPHHHPHDASNTSYSSIDENEVFGDDCADWVKGH